MICFNQKSENIARMILSTKSTTDEIHAGNDILMAENILFVLNHPQSSMKQSFELYQDAIKLNQTLRQKYPLIDNLQYIANCLAETSPNCSSGTANSADDIQHHLRMDVRGILTTVLIKHQLIEEVKDVLEDQKQF